MFQSKLYKGIFISLLSTILLSFTGCGGGSDEGENSINAITTAMTASDEITGTVAVGSGVRADIEIVGQHGLRVTGSSDSEGSFTIDASTLTTPYVLKATLLRDGVILYSYVDVGEGVANITPLTSYILDQAAVASGETGGASQLYGSFRNGSIPQNISQKVQEEIESLNTTITTNLLENNVSNFNHFSDRFEANHDGYDSLLDQLDIEIYQDDVVIRNNGSLLETLHYDINISKITLSGKLLDPTTQSILPNATLSFSNPHTATLTTHSDENGSFHVDVDTLRVYKLDVDLDGYKTQTLPNVASFVFTDSSLGDIFLYPENLATTTTLSGRIIDGRTSNTGIPDATLTFRAGYGNRIGEIVATQHTDINGSYSIDLPSGSYTLELAKETYLSIYSDIDAYGENRTLDFSLLQDLSALANTEFFASITLNWDVDPSDLDSHLTGPANVTGGERFHLYYANKVIWPQNNINTDQGSVCSHDEIASLDRDRIGAGGGLLPETVTICKVEEGGLYKYYVHQYAGISTIAGGDAKVTVATKSGVTRTFSAPTTNITGENDIWHVFNIDSDGNIYPINQIIGNGYDTSTLFQAPRLNGDKFASEPTIIENLPNK
jgi:hypothetical protein